MLTLKPYRYTPPLAGLNSAIDRPRLFDILDGRFERRLTVLKAGPGFGKTTLLCQAISSGLDDAVGTDVWFGCGPPDTRERELSNGLLTALGIDSTTTLALEAIVDAIWKESPRNVALFIDDAHHIEADGSGGKFLEQIVESLPLNGHLVLATRNELPFAISRLRAAGEVAVIDEAMLAFDINECSEFLTDRGIVEQANVGGWPAALQLVACAGPEFVGEYVWEEILGNLDARRVRTLARLASLDWINRERIAGVASEDISPAELLRDLPLVSKGPDDTFRLHALWQPILGQVDPEWTPELVDRAVQHLCGEEEGYEQAVYFCKAVREHGRIADVIRAAAGSIRWIRISAAELETLIGALPPELSIAPIRQYLEGLFRLLTDPPSSLPFLADARVGFRQTGELELELGVLVAQGFLAYFAGSADFLRSLIEPLQELDHPDQETLVELISGNLCVLEGRPEEALIHLDRVQQAGVDLCGLDYAAAGVAALDAGQPERAIKYARRPLHRVTAVANAGFRTTENEARWLLGKIDATELVAFDRGIPDPQSGHMHNDVVFEAGLAFQNAALGRTDPARAQLARLRVASESSIGPRARMAIAAAEMMFAVLEGASERGRATIDRALREAPLPVRFHRHSLRALPVLWVLDQNWREEIESLKVGPCFEEGLTAARALVEFREDRSGNAAAALDWTRASRFQIFFPPSLILELAIAAAAEGNKKAKAIATDLAEQCRETLRDLATREPLNNGVLDPSPKTGSSANEIAEHLRATVPGRPVDNVRLRVLGSMELIHGGQIVQDARIRRDRVRALLQYLVLHPTAWRAQICAALWPDRDEATARNNLRVNLNHLIRLLEPQRSADEPSFFVRADRDTIQLRTTDGGLEIDAVMFVSDVDAALEMDRDGYPALALARFETALERYQGDYFVDAANPEWAEIDRARLRARFVSTALRAASLRLGKAEFDRALDHAERAIAVDDLHGPSYRLQSLIHLRSGNHSAAREALQIGFRRLAEEGLEASEEMLRIDQKLRRLS